EMIGLAKAGASAHPAAQLNTPTSPIVLSRAHSRRTASRPRSRRVPKVWWGVVGAAALAAGLWWLAPWRACRRATTQTPPVPPTARNTAPRVAVVEPRPVPAPPSTPRRREPPAVRPPTQPAPAVQRQDTLVRMLRDRALAAMNRALVAGATPVDLARGGSVFQGAESLATRGQASDAMVQLATAASLWAEAGRVSRSRPPRHHHVPGDPGAGFDRMASQRDPLAALGRAQKLYSSPPVQSTLGRSPPRFSGHSVLATSVIPDPVRNLNPSEPLI